MPFVSLAELPNPSDLAHVAFGDLDQVGAEEDPTISGDRQMVSKQSDWFSLAETFPLIPAKLIKRIQSLEFIDLTKLLPNNMELVAATLWNISK